MSPADDTWASPDWQAARKYREQTERAQKAVGNGHNTKPVLLIEPGELPAVAERLRDLLAASEMLFDRGVPVRVTAPPDGLPVAVPLTNHGVVRMAHQHCRPVKNGENATLPDRVAGLYLDMVGDWDLPKLVGITSSPILTDDGRIRSAVGYDRDAGLYCFNIPELALPERPTKEQALEALADLRGTFQTFPFADAVRKFDPELGVDVVDITAPIGMDESGFLVGLLTAVCRQSLWLTPGFLLNAPQISGAGSGKGLLARAISAIAYAIRPRPFTPGNDRHEMDKRIVAELIEGTPVLFMDNINATLLRSNTLASVITERPSGVRELGKSRMVRLEHASFVVLTGNGLTVGEDLARRFVFSQLDARVEDPEVRPFKPGFLEQIEQRRAELLADALVIWRWGRQNAAIMKAGITLGSFEAWGAWVRDPLLALGCGDPVARIKEIKARDPYRQKVAELFELWWEHHGDAPTRATELADEVKAAIDPQGRGRQFIAKAVEDLAGTRQSGYVLTRQKGEGRKAVATYQLKKVVPQGDSPARHPPHPPHTHGMPEDDGDVTIASTISSGHVMGMRGMRGMPSEVAALGQELPERSEVHCDFCGRPADHQPLQHVGDGEKLAWLHRRCEAPWLHSPRGKGPQD
jgi:hypothetical protein